MEKVINQPSFKLKEPIVRFSQRGIGQSRLDTRVNTKPVLRSNFTTIKKSA